VQGQHGRRLQAIDVVDVADVQADVLAVCRPIDAADVAVSADLGLIVAERMWTVACFTQTFLVLQL